MCPLVPCKDQFMLHQMVFFAIRQATQIHIDKSLICSSFCGLPSWLVFIQSNSHVYHPRLNGNVTLSWIILSSLPCIPGALLVDIFTLHFAMSYFPKMWQASFHSHGENWELKQILKDLLKDHFQKSYFITHKFYWL